MVDHPHACVLRKGGPSLAPKSRASTLDTEIHRPSPAENLQSDTDHYPKIEGFLAAVRLALSTCQQSAITDQATSASQPIR